MRWSSAARGLAAGVAWLSGTASGEEFSMARDDGVHPIASSGIIFFGYGADDETAKYYLKQAVVSARRIKSLNPGVNTTLVTNPGLEFDREGAFDMVIPIEDKYMYDGKARSGSSPIHRQWLTRLQYMSRSPYEVTLALDSQALCCGTEVENLLDQLRWSEFDIAFAVQGPRMLSPHNWAIAYRLNFNTRRLFARWQKLQIDYSRSGTDQLTLHMAAGSLALQDKLNVGVLSETTAMAMVVFNRTGPAHPKTSLLVGPHPVNFVHYNADSPEDEETTCATLNTESNRARVVMQPRPWPRDQETQQRIGNNYQILYSVEELAEAANEARKGAPYFGGLDWENASGKWGRVATPWQDHYPDCWADLAMEVNLGVRHIYKNPSSIWDNTHFADEFRDDHLEWPSEASYSSKRHGSKKHKHERKRNRHGRRKAAANETSAPDIDHEGSNSIPPPSPVEAMDEGVREYVL